MTSAGVPWNCSSDLPAEMAMLTLKALGGAAQADHHGVTLPAG